MSLVNLDICKSAFEKRGLGVEMASGMDLDFQ